MKSYSFLLRFIGIILFVYLLSTIEFSSLSTIVTNIQVIDILIIILLFIPQILTKVFRWRIILSTMNIHYPLKKAFHAYTVSIFTGTITLGRLGEFAKMFYLREEGHSYGKSFFSVIIDRLYDLLFLLILAGIATILFLGTQHLIIIGTLIAVIGLGICWIYFKQEQFISLVKIIVPKKYHKKILKELIPTIKVIQPTQQISLIFWTVSTWAIYFFQVYYLLRVLHIPIDYITLALFLSISAIITMIPISISGLGTRDATLIYLYGFIELAKQDAIITSFSVIIIYLLISIIGFFFWLYRPISLNKLKKGAK